MPKLEECETVDDVIAWIKKVHESWAVEFIASVLARAGMNEDAAIDAVTNVLYPSLPKEA